MPNMSYCKFQNTADDLEDCFKAMEENNFDVENLSESERRGYEKLIELCNEIVTL